MSRTTIIIAMLIFQIEFVCSNIHYAKYKMHEIYEIQGIHRNVYQQ